MGTKLTRLDTALELDPALENTRITSRITKTLRGFRRRGCVVAISGGIDSSVCAALAVAAVGGDRVFGLLLPERDSSESSTARGEMLVRHLGIRHLKQDIADTLEAIGCYRERDDAIRAVVPEFGSGWKQKIVIAGGIERGVNYFNIVVQAPDGATFKRRLPHEHYLRIVAATNYKQRIRKTIEYFHADRLNYAVIGTPNRLEYDQGFFVKNGDGSADLKPIAHLYKTQVYEMAGFLELPEEICSAVPTTDTYSLPQGQDEFYFALPYRQMDLALWAYGHDVPVEELGEALRIPPDRVERVYRDIEAKRRAAAYLGAPPVLAGGI
jgi:NAD+ synthase